VALRIVETSDPAETESLGAELVPGLGDGDVVLVRGELGSGKTTLVRGAARALGVSDPVTSPTFSIGHRYRATNVTVSHLDLYRLQGLEHEDPALLADYLGPGRIAFVEWPPEADGELSSARLLVTLSHRGGDRRLIEVGSGPAGLADGPGAVADGPGAVADGQAGVVGGPAKVAERGARG
jgi:tRNA threonylcarbamoyladenosine biosynthesis protein TsaE